MFREYRMEPIEGESWVVTRETPQAHGAGRKPPLMASQGCPVARSCSINVLGDVTKGDGGCSSNWEGGEEGQKEDGQVSVSACTL